MRVALGLAMVSMGIGAGPALAQDAPMPRRGGAEFRLLVPVQQPQVLGLLYGGPQGRAVNPWMSLGLAGYGGVFVRNGLRGGMVYGGPYFGLENPLGGGWRLDVDAM